MLRKSGKKSKVKVTRKITLALYYSKCVAANGMGLLVDMTACIFHLLCTLIPASPRPCGADVINMSVFV